MQGTADVSQAAYASGHLDPPGFHPHADALRLRRSHISAEEFSTGITAAQRVTAIIFDTLLTST